MGDPQSNFFDEEGWRYGAQFQDGSVSNTFNGRTQRAQAEKSIAEMRKGRKDPFPILVRRKMHGTWEPVYQRPFVLGETVTINRALAKTHERRSRPSKWNPQRMTDEHWRVWKPVSLLAATGDKEVVVGIVIGTRTLMNVERVYIGYEEGWDNDLSSAERFQAVWVAYDLRRKPVFVLPEDAHRIEG